MASTKGDIPINGSSSLNNLAAAIRPYTHSPMPVWGLSGLFLTSSLIPPSPHIPPLMYRIGFGAIFGGAGYVLSCGDSQNGSGITTAWSLTYLFLNLRKSLRPPLSPVSLALTAATLASTALYGTEYFVLHEKETE